MCLEKAIISESFVVELEQDVQWLKEAGFDEVVKRYRGEIDMEHLQF